MRHKMMLVAAVCGIAGAATLMVARRGDTARGPLYHSPQAMVLGAGGKVLYVADYTADSVAAIDAKSGAVIARVSIITPTGLALSADGATLYVASGDRDKVYNVTAATMKLKSGVPVGRRPAGILLSPDGKQLYSCDQFSDRVSVVDTAKMKVARKLAVQREPRSCALAEGGKTLVVSNHLPLGSNLDDNLGAEVSLVSLDDGATTQVQLSRGATDVGQVVVSADGQYAFVIHVLARWLVPPTQLDRGWVSTNALTVIDVPARKRLGTVLLDDLDRGAANGYGLALSADGKQLYSTHSGTNEVQVMDTEKLLALIKGWPADSAVALEDDLTAVYRAGVRKRVSSGGIGPRAIVADGDSVLVGNYFSGTVARIGLERGKVTETLSLGAQPEMDVARRGEMLFNDAVICFQGWQSCATCHPEGRTDALAWDLLNDGIGNPKNAKSMLLCDQTPPAMGHGIRADMDVAISAGLKYILFHVPTDEEIATIGAYIRSMKPERSPFRSLDGKLSPAAKRGKLIYEDPKVACATCHPAPLYTDKQMYETDTMGPFDQRGDFDTPTLVETFRTAPYLHDGGAVTMMQVLKEYNKNDKHGVTSHLTEQQLKDLAEYVLSL